MSDAARNGMLQEVREGLLKDQKELSSKYFYDRRGSELFEEITRLPEYYLTRAETRILDGTIRDWLRDTAMASLVEFGSGSGRKTRLILDGMLRPNGPKPDGVPAEDGLEPPRDPGSEGGIDFVPVDVSAEFLAQSAEELRRDYPNLRIEPLVADMSAPDFLQGAESGWLSREELGRPALFALLGSTIGNFRPRAATDLLGRIAGIMRPGDHFLVGADLRPGPEKSVQRLERAYDDAAGVTARFNRNVLRVLNRELGTDFDLADFRHRAFYDETAHRIEMHLEAVTPQEIRLPDGSRIPLREGETIRTEVSHKYDRATVESLMENGGMRLTRWLPGADGLYAMAVGRVARESNGRRGDGPEGR